MLFVEWGYLAMFISFEMVDPRISMYWRKAENQMKTIHFTLSILNNTFTKEDDYDAFVSLCRN